MVADDLYDTHQWNGDHHSTDSPNHLAGNKPNDGDQRVDVHFAAKDQRLEQITLNELHYTIGDHNPDHGVCAPALHQSHDHCNDVTNQISDERNNFQETT